MRRLVLCCLSLILLDACQTGPVRLAGETDVHCIHRLYDYPVRTAPFQAAASLCAGGHPLDLTGDHYYQLLATSLNVPYVSRDPRGSDTISLTGSRVPQPTDVLPPPELTLH